MPEFEVEERLVRMARRVARVEGVDFQEALRRTMLRKAAEWPPPAPRKRPRSEK